MVHARFVKHSRPATRCLANPDPTPTHPHGAAVGDGGVIKTIVKEGSGWAKPQPQDEVCVRFSARVQVRRAGASLRPACKGAEDREHPDST